MSYTTNLISKPLGKNGPVVPRLGLGLMNNSGAYNAAGSDEERFAFLDKAYEIGERFWDSADMYDDSEDLLGKWFKRNPGKREHIFLATKFAIDKSDIHNIKISSSPEYARKAIDKSLQRLGLDSVDLYYVHRVDGVTPIEKTIEALAEIKKAGKIRYIGLSACSAETLRRAHAVHPITAVQMEYSIFDTRIESPERNVLATARELGVAVVAYSPLGRGLLTGAVNFSDADADVDIRRKMGFPWFNDENFGKNKAIVSQLGEIAKAKGISTSQLCLAWILAQGDDMFAIPGTRRVERLQENLSSLEVKLTPEEAEKIRELGSQVAGMSHKPEHMALEFGNTPPLN